ncbi:MAG: hypothetical protein Q9163_000739 [Psora crenata]
MIAAANQLTDFRRNVVTHENRMDDDSDDKDNGLTAAVFRNMVKRFTQRLNAERRADCPGGKKDNALTAAVSRNMVKRLTRPNAERRASRPGEKKQPNQLDYLAHQAKSLRQISTSLDGILDIMRFRFGPS